MLVLRTARVLLLAWYVRHLYRRAERRAKAAKDKGEEDEIWDACDDQVSRLICGQMISLQGVWIKLGQFLSTRADVMPDVWVENLKRLQDAVPREAWRKTSRTLRECFGDGLAAFEEIDQRPLATASIASVHRAALFDQQSAGCGAVVVKVQRRGIRAIIESDLRNLKFIVRKAASENSKFDFTAMIDEWTDETLRELDFVNEALNTELVRHNLAGVEGVKVPKVVRSAGVSPTQRALVLEYVEGDKVTATSALDHRAPEQLVDTLSAAYAQQVFVDGVFNADPHPGARLSELDAALFLVCSAALVLCCNKRRAHSTSFHSLLHVLHSKFVLRCDHLRRKSDGRAHVGCPRASGFWSHQARVAFATRRVCKAAPLGCRRRLCRIVAGAQGDGAGRVHRQPRGRYGRDALPTARLRGRGACPTPIGARGQVLDHPHSRRRWWLQAAARRWQTLPHPCDSRLGAVPAACSRVLAWHGNHAGR